jgi:valyl-tRNA synthetase
LDVIHLYGADAMRYTVVAGMGMGADLMLDPADLEKSFAAGRNFVTKLQNIGRFVLSNLGDAVVLPIHEIAPEKFTRADRWMLGRLNMVVQECDAALGPARPAGGSWKVEELRAGLRLNEYAESARRFVWNDLADWYLETTKGRMPVPGEDRDVARAVLVHAFDVALRLLQPIVPFVADRLWQQLPVAGKAEGATLAKEPWPRVRAEPNGAHEFERVRDCIVALRQTRADYAIPASSSLEVFVDTARDRDPSGAMEVLKGEAALISRLAKATLRFDAVASSNAAAHSLLSQGTELIIPLGDIVDVARECRRLRGELEQLQKQLQALRGRLKNDGFISRAPAGIVDAERSKEVDWAKREMQLEQKVKALCG